VLGIRAIYITVQQQHQQGVIFYSISGHQVIGWFKGKQAMLLVDKKLCEQDKKFTYHIKLSQLTLGICANEFYTFTQAVDNLSVPLANYNGIKIGVWGQKKFVFVD
jgi:hypothetical protein